MRNKHATYLWGQWAEHLGALYLICKGYHILARHYVVGRGTHAGEIDLIARRGRVIVFVEVKARRTYDNAAHALMQQQQQRIYRSAEAFLQQHPQYHNLTYRFDVILMVPWSWPRHITNAWRAFS